ncbi:MAG: Transcriptional activator of fatty acid utilization [Pycnora praestabilis]|nr:MAG: Transcriptional activator of fatty acid utilization [Pycnora praestabilis]
MPPATGDGFRNGLSDDTAYPSRNIAFQAAAMITSIVENLQAHDELRFCPAFIVYSLFSALIMLVYQMRSSNASVVAQTQERMRTCMNALREVSKTWLVAKMVHTLFESILGNKVLEERLQKAAGKRHGRPKMPLMPSATATTALRREESTKRKYDDMELGYTNAPPAPQVSYERSRPQTPAATPSHEIGHQQPLAPMSAPGSGQSPHLRQQADSFLGGLGTSRNNTRPPTPFNPSYSVPATPPDLFLVTRNSPTISQSLWESFQPDQLFPEGTNMSMPFVSPQTQATLDPQLAHHQSMPQMHTLHTTQQQAAQQPQLHHHSHSMSSQTMSNGAMSNQTSPVSQPLPRMIRPSAVSSTDPIAGLHASQVHNMHNIQTQNPTHGWPNQFENLETTATDASPEDSWSTSSLGQGPAVPTTLNVEDWFQFFGINGDMSGMGNDGL